MTRLDAYFLRALNAEASDVHLCSGSSPMMRVNGRLVPIPDEAAISDAELRQMLCEATSQRQWQRFECDLDLDFAMSTNGVARFRGNCFVQEHGVTAVFRRISDPTGSIDELGLPSAVHSLADLHAGLVLVSGTAGSGKSTTLAAILELINRKHARHIVTIEAPVELLHTNKKSVISQREVGRDSRGFVPALRAALRQNADVILVSDLSDPEILSLALEAASMGVLVLGALNSHGAAKTVDHVVQTFPKSEQQRTRVALADCLAAVISQSLVARKAGGHVAAHEVLLRTNGLSGVIREGQSAMIQSIIGAGRALGMQTLDGALMGLVERGVIHGRDAYHNASDKKAFAAFATG